MLPIQGIVNAHGTPAQVAMLGSANTDWQDQIYRTAFSTDNISPEGALIIYRYRIFICYANQNGVVKTDTCNEPR